MSGFMRLMCFMSTSFKSFQTFTLGLFFSIFYQAARLGILPAGRGKTVPAQGRGRGRGRGGRGRGMLNHMVVDHRPKALTVGGFVEEEKDELLQHFSVSIRLR